MISTRYEKLTKKGKIRDTFALLFINQFGRDIIKKCLYKIEYIYKYLSFSVLFDPI